MPSSCVPALYPRLVGADWAALPEAVRAVHAGETEMRATGRFTVRGSSGRLARLLARLGGLPRPGTEVATELCVRPEPPGELWRRSFGAERLVTRQWEEDGLLVEQIGLMQLVFSLSVVDGVLKFRQVAARVGLGRRHVPLHRWLAPEVTARTWADGGVRVQVDVRLPAAGLLCAYDGVLSNPGAK
jgi:uncharacterized protein DUF4166